MLLILRLTGVLANQTGKNSRKTQTDPESRRAASPTCILAVRQPLPIITNWWACCMADGIAANILKRSRKTTKAGLMKREACPSCSETRLINFMPYLENREGLFVFVRTTIPNAMTGRPATQMCRPRELIRETSCGGEHIEIWDLLEGYHRLHQHLTYVSQCNDAENLG